MKYEDFDQILHDALTPEVPEERLLYFKKRTDACLPTSSERTDACLPTDLKKPNESEETIMKWKYLCRTAIAMAACAALILGASHLPGLKASRNETTTDTGNTLIGKLENAFTVQVMAAGEKKTVTKEKPIPILSNAASNSHGYSGSCAVKYIETEDGTRIPADASAYDGEDFRTSYFVSFPITCDGKNIDTITYSINKGTFKITAKKDSNFVLRGTRYEGTDSFGGIQPVSLDKELSAEEENERIQDYETALYTSYTVSADNQASDDIAVCICDDVAMSYEGYLKMWDFENKTLQDQLEGCSEVIGNTIVTCEITYKDGTRQTAKIKVGNAIMTPAEAGMDITEEEIPEAEIKKTESVFITYELM